MAWRPTQYLIEGELENRTPGRVTGWLRFEGMQEPVALFLMGDFHRDIRGAAIRITGQALEAKKVTEVHYMTGFATFQRGEVGDITAGLEPFDYGRDPYIEWYSDQNGRVVLELAREDIRVKGEPLPFVETEPIDRTNQDALMAGWLATLSEGSGLPALFATKSWAPGTEGAYTHWIQIEGRIIAEAEPLMPVNDEFLGVRVRTLIGEPIVTFGVVSKKQLQRKKTAPVA